MKIVIIILLACAVALIVLSIILTAKLFRCFGEEQIDSEPVKRYRTRMIGCYIGAVLLITAAALIKLLM